MSTTDILPATQTTTTTTTTISTTFKPLNVIWSEWADCNASCCGCKGEEKRTKTQTIYGRPATSTEWRSCTKDCTNNATTTQRPISDFGTHDILVTWHLL